MNTKVGNSDIFKDWECGVQGSRRKGQIQATTTVSHFPNVNLLKPQSTNMLSWQVILGKSTKYKKLVSHKFSPRVFISDPVSLQRNREH